jgi:hypothetical protein
VGGEEVATFTWGVGALLWAQQVGGGMGAIRHHNHSCRLSSYPFLQFSHLFLDDEIVDFSGDVVKEITEAVPLTEKTKVWRWLCAGVRRCFLSLVF